MSRRTTIKRSQLQPWLQNRRYLWPIAGMMGLILTTPWWLVFEVAPMAAGLVWKWKYSMQDSWAVMLGRVEE